MFIQHLFSDPYYFFSWIIIMLFSVCLHELFHALAAYWQGDDTAKSQGYFTLNPMVHMGPPSLILLVLVGLCWGACPVDPSRFRHRYGSAIVSFAGPFANLLLLLLFAFLAVLIDKSGIAAPVSDNLATFFFLAAITNAALFILNMLPVPPLDGHTVCADFIPQLRPFYAKIGDGAFAIIFLLFWLPIGFNELFWGLARGAAQNSYSLIGFFI